MRKGYYNGGRNGTFDQQVNLRQKLKPDGQSNEFVFYDGPPFANGLPHYGHIATGFVKDIIPRFQAMRGRHVERKFGWDCHGLPAELEVEKEIQVFGRTAILDYGIAKFNEQCRTSVQRYTRDWEWYVQRQARWVSFKDSYRTMDTTFMESMFWAFTHQSVNMTTFLLYLWCPFVRRGHETRWSRL